MLDAVTVGVVQAETDFLQYAESYYFVEEENDPSLAATLPHAWVLAETGKGASSPEVRLTADMLAAAVESLAQRLDQSYLKTGSATPQVLATYEADHEIEPPA